MATPHHSHQAPRRELLPGVTRRAAAMVAGVLLLQLGFVLSYVGAFHSPAPRDIPIAVVAPAGAPTGTAQSVVDQLESIASNPLDARVADDESAGRALLSDRDVDGVFVIGADGADRLLVASAEGGSVSAALAQVFARIEAVQQRTVTTDDVLAAGAQDARGLTPFYLAVGWVVGGYLVSAIIAMGSGARPLTRQRGRVRLGSLAVYALASGLGGSLVAGPLLGALSGHLLALAGFGALLVFAVGAFTMALQAWTGTIGIGLAILLFVILGNPSAGGAYPAPLLPPFWAAIGPWLPPGAGTSAVRGIVYFHGAGVWRGCLVVIGYAVVGVLAVLIGSGRGRGRSVDPADTAVLPAEPVPAG